jgi:hypothetical protein
MPDKAAYFADALISCTPNNCLSAGRSRYTKVADAFGDFVRLFIGAVYILLLIAFQENVCSQLSASLNIIM